MREARLCARLRHPNIVQVHQVGITPRGLVYIVMELAGGRSLQSWVTSRAEVPGRLDGGRDHLHSAVYPIIFQLCDAVAAAHAGGIIHRDIKPANVQIEEDGRVRLMDFGLALLRSHSELETDAAGTPAYMAPEQLLSPGATDHRCDVHGLGGVLYFLLTGKAPRDFSAASGPPTAVIRRSGQKARRSQYPKRVPSELIAVVEKALRLKPQDRFASVGDMRAALERVYLAQMETRDGMSATLGAKVRMTLALLLLLVLGGIGIAVSLGQRGRATESESLRSGAVELRQEIGIYLEREDLAARQRGLLLAWAGEIDARLGESREEEAFQVARLARDYIRREELRELAQAMKQLAARDRIAPDLRERVLRFGETVDAAMAAEEFQESLVSLHADGLALLRAISAVPVP